MRLGTAKTVPAQKPPPKKSPAQYSAIPTPARPAKPTPSVTVQPITPIQPLAPIAEVPDPIFGSGQKLPSTPDAPITSTGIPGADDFLSASSEPNPYENTAYAPPAPIERPRPRRTRKGPVQKSTAGPTMSIVSGIIGTLYGLACVVIFGLAVSLFLAAVSSDKGVPNVDSMFRGITSGILLLLSLGITASCAFSAITGIMELTSNTRNPGPSQTAGTVCITYVIIILLLTFVGIAMAIAMQANIGRIEYDGVDTAAMVIGIVIALAIQFMFILIPLFVFLVGHFRNR